ncbi:cytochrome c oxidase cbb3-type subunit 3 [Geoalkalibacter ferrihydriticus]|uniref:Cytochrome c domain-containing protein n=2 Tax=Geoalkalibacter ferrihydriticus TaxID=392333 RepID=A0A0C2HMX6_9BACT|nr:c-type cytochrome [Geoalkalibacter ferrihydriticus]KIH76320.1 hypothetical protein GFER_11995 [Geoalkalibacter ferrihydriticus DSM 17813]SDL20916.1 cytochrome c oxidase cbb3-type subunit 3 [Geoalkalibacter ferrihydriticus]
MLEDHQHKRPAREFDGLIEMRSTPVPRYFSILFYGLIIWGVLFMAYYLFSGWSSEGEFARKMSAHLEQTAAQQTQPGTQATPAVDADEARHLYNQHCAACHGGSGQGGIGPALDDTQYKYGNEREAVIQSIAQGRPAGMPGYNNQFSAAQIEALADYLKKL